ncbi:MAG: thiamine pyrophosphate-binding protein [Chloroflexi bacterium]|nr:thiamine pyrophosphate-binding protein [Chloroflexota bacterium]
MPRMLGKNAVMEQLLADGVQYIFGNPGSTELALMDALQDYRQIQYILALHEAVAMGMADGYARATRRPSFVNLHIAPGLANGISMLYNAYRGHTPLVVTAGQQDTRMVLQEPALWGDLVQMAAQYTKWCVEVQHVEDIPMVLRRAFKVAAEAPQGPVFVSLPQNTLSDEGEMRIVPTSYTEWRTRPNPDAVERAAALLTAAQRPVVVCGDGVPLSNAGPELVRLAELLGAPIFSVGRTDPGFHTGHPLYLGGFNLLAMAGTRDQLGKADVLLLVGGSFLNLTNQLIYDPTPVLPDDITIIHLDVNSWEIAKTFPVEIGMVGDARLGLRDLTEAAERRMGEAARSAARVRASATAAQKQRMRDAAERQLQAEWEHTPISPLRLVAELRDMLPRGAAIVGGGGTSGGPALRQLLDFDAGTYFGGGGGALGFDLPGPLGVKLAFPDRPVVGFCAEGNAMYTDQALWTAAHYDIPVTYVMVNNASYRILKMNMVRYLGESGRKSEYLGMDFGEPVLDLAKLARVWGIHGVRVERPDELRPALRDALALGRPAVVDVVVDGSYGDFF